MRENFSKSETLICRALTRNKNLSITQISNQTDLPTWKVSRKLKQLEIEGIVHYEVENRHKRGRPRKFYKLETEKFGILNEWRDED